MSFVAPYLAPMLERAGARVYLPRERDRQYLEVIVDNDSSGDAAGEAYAERSSYVESDSLYPYFRQWATSSQEGFGHGDGILKGSENPFREGTLRFVETDSVSTSSAAWIPTMPARGEYAVYVSYGSLPNATRDARYTVHHLGGETTFLVDQQMGGRTWTHLGTFLFGKE